MDTRLKMKTEINVLYPTSSSSYCSKLSNRKKLMYLGMYSTYLSIYIAVVCLSVIVNEMTQKESHQLAAIIIKSIHLILNSLC